jgi:hypothetical protein
MDTVFHDIDNLEVMCIYMICGTEAVYLMTLLSECKKRSVYALSVDDL